MGIIGEGRLALDEVEAQNAQISAEQRAATISARLGDLSGTLADPLYVGDIETALVHHMGERAFTDTESTGPYLALAERLKGEIEDGADPQVPIVFIFEESDESVAQAGVTTVFARLQSDSPRFKSSTERNEAVRMDVYTATTAGVTASRLSLIARNHRFTGNILTADHPLSDDGLSSGSMVLRDSRVADSPYGQGIPSDHAFSNSINDRLAGNPQIFVGWDEIQAAVLGNFDFEANRLEDAAKLEAFFNATVSRETLTEYAPLIADVIDASNIYLRTMGRIASLADLPE